MAVVRVLVGTRKGAWVYTSDAARTSWTISKPMIPGWSVSHMNVDTRRGTPRLFASGGHWAWGP